MLIPLIGTGLIIANREDQNKREACSLGAAVLMFLTVVSMVPSVLDGNTFHYTLFTFLEEVSFTLNVDALGLIFATVASALWLITTVYSIGYMRAHKEKNQTRYYACFAVTLSMTMGVAFSANLVTLYLFYEMLTLITYPLVAHSGTDEAYAGANKYLFYLLGTSKAFLLAAILITYAVAGTLEFQPGGLFPANANTTALVVVFFLFLAGVGKAAIMPLHAWLPAAMVAPTPVSALLHAVAVVNTGVFAVLRIMFHVFGVDLMRSLHLGTATAILASFTILMASMYAMTRDNLKARLAYSTISQLSYIILGGALLSPSGMTGGVIHIANHAFSKITLFFAAGSIFVASHKTNISQMNGIGRQMPWTMTAFAIATLSMIGIPPSAGFVSKWYLAIGTIEADQIAILFVLLASTLLNAIYFVPIVFNAFFKPPQDLALAHAAAGDKDGHDEVPHHVGEVSPFIVAPMMVTAIISLILGMFPDIFLSLVKQVIG
ncbi:monovalent cation/H+ antiporter subunit D family protein [Nitrospira defluvii]|nr:monovalent cation/H+ antiporter subunit D family protein [Nitrospira defluvii]